LNIQDANNIIGSVTTIDDLASDLLNKVVDEEAELLSNGDANFSEEQVKQAQVMTRRDIVLLASYMSNNTRLTQATVKLLERQNIMIFILTGAVLVLSTILWLK